MQVTVI